LHYFYTLSVALLCVLNSYGLNDNSINHSDSLLFAIERESDFDTQKKIVSAFVKKCGTNLQCIINHEKNLKKTTPRLLAHFYLEAAKPHISREEFDPAIEFLHKGAKTSSLNQLFDLEARFLTLIGQMYSGKSQLDSALTYHNLAISRYNSLENNYLIWNAYFGRAMTLHQAENTEKAIDDMWQAYLIVKDKTSRMDKGFVMYYLLDWLVNQKSESDRYFAVLEDYINFKQEGSSETEDYHIETLSFENPDIGIAHLEHHLSKMKQETDFATAGVHYMMLGDLYSEKSSFQKAIENYGKAANYMEQKGMTYLLKVIYSKLYQAYRDAGNTENALNIFEKLRNHEDSIYSIEHTKALLEIQTRFETEVKDRQLAQQELTIQRRNNQIAWFSGGFILLIISSIWAYTAQRKRQLHRQAIQLKEQELQNQKISDLQRQNKFIAMQSMIEGQEAERTRIARDLHDGVGGLLTSLQAYTQTLAAHAPQPIYNETTDLLNIACEEVRRVSHNLVPLALSTYGLEVAIEDLGRNLEKAQIKPTVYIHDLPHNLTETTQITIYRIIQELIQNIIKHSKATEALIQIIGQPEIIHITVEDNGVGFSPDSKGGLGMKSIESRTTYLNGKLSVDSEVNKGTTITIEIPT
jgi:two-component system, NarL family, sensor kinase